MDCGDIVLTFDGGFTMIVTDDFTKIGPVSVSWKTAAGHPAKVDGATKFASDNESVAAVVEEADGGVFIILGDLGKAQITATADADLGEGVEPVMAIGDLEYVAGKAVAGVLDFGTPA
jgi:hypothetical protein